VVVTALCVLTAACGLGTSADDGAEHIRSRSRAHLSPAVAAIGHRLVAVPDGIAPPIVYVSRAGRRWEGIRLPGGPAMLTWGLEPLRRYGHVLTLSAQGSTPYPGASGSGRADGAPYVWRTKDGRHWVGGAIAPVRGRQEGSRVFAAGRDLLTSVDDTDGTTSVLTARGTRGWRTATVDGLGLGPTERTTLAAVWRDRGVLIGLLRYWGTRTAIEPDPHFFPAEIRSSDGGATWTVAPCEPETDAGSLQCVGELHADRLAVRGSDVSTDGGATWDKAGIAAPRGVTIRPDFTSLVRADGAWLATVSYDDFGWDDPLVHLLRSTDGRTWRRVAACTRPGRRLSAFTPPVRVEDRWYTERSCRPAPGTEPATGSESPILLTSRDGEDWAPVHVRPPKDTRLGPPLPFEGRVRLPVVDRNGRLAGFEVVRG
jgi:hypothetical protein